MKKTAVSAVVIAAIVLMCGTAFCACGACGTCGSGTDKAHSVNVNNTVCPVLGEKIDMKNPTTVDYNGKTYNLCCKACVAEFNKDPQKYSAKAEAK